MGDKDEDVPQKLPILAQEEIVPQKIPKLARVYFVQMLDKKKACQTISTDDIKNYKHGSSEKFYYSACKNGFGEKVFLESQILATGDTEEELDQIIIDKRPSKTTKRRSSVEVIITKRERQVQKVVKDTNSDIVPMDDDEQEYSSDGYVPATPDSDDKTESDGVIDTMEYCMKGPSRVSKTKKGKGKMDDQVNEEEDPLSGTESKAPNRRGRTVNRQGAKRNKPLPEKITSEDEEVVKQAIRNNPLRFEDDQNYFGEDSTTESLKSQLVTLVATSKEDRAKIAQMQKTIDLLVAKLGDEGITHADQRQHFEQTKKSEQPQNYEDVLHPTSRRKLGFGGLVASENGETNLKIGASTPEKDREAVNKYISEPQRPETENDDDIQQICDTDETNEIESKSNDGQEHVSDIKCGDDSRMIVHNSKKLEKRQLSETSSDETESNGVNEDRTKMKKPKMDKQQTRGINRLDSDSDDDRVVKKIPRKGAGRRQNNDDDDDDDDDDNESAEIFETDDETPKKKKKKAKKYVKRGKNDKQKKKSIGKAVKKVDEQWRKEHVPSRKVRNIATGKNRLAIDYFSEKEEKAMEKAVEDMEKNNVTKKDFTKYTYPNPADPRNPIEKYHLCYGLEIPYDAWQTACRGDIDSFMRQLCQSVHTVLELGNRTLTKACDLPLRSPRRQISPLKMVVIKKSYKYRVDKTIEEPRRSAVLDFTFWRPIISSSINNCHTVALAHALAEVKKLEDEKRRTAAREAENPGETDAGATPVASNPGVSNP